MATKRDFIKDDKVIRTGAEDDIGDVVEVVNQKQIYVHFKGNTPYKGVFDYDDDELTLIEPANPAK